MVKKKRVLTAKQKKYFAPRTPKKRRNVLMARRKKSYGRKMGGFLGGFNDVFVGIAAGAVENVAPSIMGIDGIPTTAIGVFMKNNTLKTMGGYMIGNSLIGKFTGNQNGGNGGGY